MPPLMFFMLSICLKLAKVEEINFTAKETGRSLADEELQELIDEGYYKYTVEEVEHEVNYMNILIFTKLEFRVAVKDKRRFWPKGIVPYVISKQYDSEQKKVILEGMNAFKNRTCISFTPRKNESAFIFIKPGFGCSATIGKVNKPVVTLGKGCYQKGIVIHELMHILGFLHEQSRPDRDKFVKINFDNISEKQRKNFDRYPEFLIQTGNISYDYGSIMHYGPFTFAKNKSVPTIIPLQKGVTIGQRIDFSQKDIEQINIFYNCSKQERRRIKRHDPHRVPEAYPSNARQVEYDSRFAPVDFSLPKFTPVRNPRPAYVPEVYREPAYPSVDRPVSPISHSKPVQVPVEYQWPSFSPVEPPKSVYEPAEQPKLPYFPESQHSFYPPEIPRRLKYPSVEHQEGPRDYYEPPPRNYRRPEFSRPSYTTPGYRRLHTPVDYPKPVHTRPTYTTAGYRRPSYAPMNYPKTGYSPVYPRPRPYIFSPVSNSYTQPFYETTISPTETTATTEGTTTEFSRPSYTTPGYHRLLPPVDYPKSVYTRPTYTTAGYRRPFYAPMNYPNTGYSPVYPRPRPSYQRETETPVNNSYTQPSYETTLSPTEATATTEGTTTVTTNTPLTTQDPVGTKIETSTSAPTSTVAITTTTAPTGTPVTTMTATPSSITATAETAIDITTSTETIAASTSTQEQISTVVTTVGIESTTSAEYYKYDLTSRNSELFVTDGKEHSVAYHKIHVFTDIESRTVLKDPSALWTRGVVPYEFSDKYDSQQKGFLLEAMQEFHDKTCVRFVPRRNQATYIFVEPEVRCSAHIGKIQGSVNTVTISEGCYLSGTIIHELMHTLGFVHEQNRPDRDQFVIVMWENIIPDGEKNFRKYSWDEVQDFDVGYDYESIMHYGRNEFAEDPDRPTLVPLQAGVKIGQRDGFSRKDLTKINRLYNCRKEQDKEPVKATPIEEFKKYFQSNIQRLFRSLMRAIQNFRPSKPKN